MPPAKPTDERLFASLSQYPVARRASNQTAPYKSAEARDSYIVDLPDRRQGLRSDIACGLETRSPTTTMMTDMLRVYLALTHLWGSAQLDTGMINAGDIV